VNSKVEILSLKFNFVFTTYYMNYRTSSNPRLVMSAFDAVTTQYIGLHLKGFVSVNGEVDIVTPAFMFWGNCVSLNCSSQESNQFR